MREILKIISDAEIESHNAAVKRTGDADGVPLITFLGLLEGEVLTRVEEKGQTTLRSLIREMRGSVHLVVMAVGSLIRARLIGATQTEEDVILKIIRID